MPSIITNRMRKKIANDLFTELVDTTDSAEYYIGIGKADQYDDSDNVASITRTPREERIARGNLQSVKRITNLSVSFAAQRYNWTSGGIYSAYDDSVVATPYPFYVLTENNEVYICLQQGKNSLGQTVNSTVQPNYSTAGVSQTQAFETADGYRWKYLYSITAIKGNTFLSANYIPVEYLTDSANAYTGLERDQALVQEAAVPGQVLGIKVTSGGTGYSSAPTVTVVGNGSSAAATATISGGSVVKIEMNNESAALGSGYNFASINFSGGSPTTAATAIPIIGAANGLGANAIDDLQSTSLMLTARPNGDENGTFLVNGQDFRQIVLIKDALYKDSSAIFDGAAGLALRSLRVDSNSTLSIDNVLQGTNASAYIDEVRDGNIVFYHQNQNTGFGTFTNGENVTDGAGGTAQIIEAADSYSRGAEFNAWSGEIFYIENRAAVERDSQQSEDIKIVLTF